MPLSWNDIRANATAFVREWRDDASEDAEAKSFLDAFFVVFGMPRRRVAAFERRVKRLDGGNYLFTTAERDEWRATIILTSRNPKGFQSFTLYAIRGLRERFAQYDKEVTVFGSINKRDFESLQIVEPSDEVLSSFEKIVSPLDSRIAVNEEHVRTYFSPRHPAPPPDLRQAAPAGRRGRRRGSRSLSRVDDGRMSSTRR